MLKKHLMSGLVLCFFGIGTISVAIAEDAAPACEKLAGKAGGDTLKFSLHAEVDGPMFFSGIGCAVKYRNKVLCAMEMLSFDRTARVYDFHTAEEIKINAAYFWLDGENDEAPVLAFRDKEDAEKYGAEKGRGAILDYAGLTGLRLK